MFLTEKELREVFWENYNYSNRAIRYQFECAIREGGTDLVTIEQFQGNYQINAFEFKLSDIKKVVLQAEANQEYVHKSWIVVPSEKEELIKYKYLSYIRGKQLGVITVEDGGRWKVLQLPGYREDIKLNKALVNLMMKGY